MSVVRSGWWCDGCSTSLLSLLLAGAIGCNAPPAAQGLRPRPLGRNVLLVLADDLGTDKVGVYGEGGAAPSTPVLDQLAADGVLFRNAYAHPTCAPARAALLTGRWARRTGLGRNVEITPGAPMLAESEVLIPEVLAGAGYSSAVVGKWHLAPLTEDLRYDAPLRQGFEHHRGAPAFLGAPNQSQRYWRWVKATDGVLAWVEGYATTVEVDDALALIEELPEPWFVFVSLHAPHEPWHAPPDELVHHPVSEDAPVPDRYDAAVEAMDTELGRLLAGLGDARADTNVIFTGDNGTPGVATRPPFSSLHAKTSLFEQGTGVPLIISGPFVTQPGSETSALASLVDLLPTVAEMAGASLSSGPTRDGVSLLPVVEDVGAPGPREVVFTERIYTNQPPPWDKDWRTVRGPRFKLMRTQSEECLFDLDGRYDDGPDLLRGMLSDSAIEAYRRLSVQLDGFDAIPYEGGVSY